MRALRTPECSFRALQTLCRLQYFDVEHCVTGDRTQSPLDVFELVLM